MSRLKCSVKGGITSKFGVKVILTVESYTETDNIVFKSKGIQSISLPLTHHSEKFFQRLNVEGRCILKMAKIGVLSVFFIILYK